MKKYLILISILSYNQMIFSQESQNYQAMIHMIDSMKLVYSSTQVINSSAVDIPYQYRHKYSDLGEKSQDKVIDHISTLYNQSKYLSLYTLASTLLEEYYSYSKDNAKTKMIELWYDKICYSSFSINYFGDSRYYSEKAKQRLLDLLSDKWTQKDTAIMKIRSELVLRQFYSNDYLKQVREIMNVTNRRGDAIRQMLLDSIVNKAVYRNMKINTNRPFSPYCILMMGSLNDARFIAGLELILEESQKYTNPIRVRESCTYALAKLGVQKYIDKVLSNDSIIHYTYLGTKEAFLRWIQINLRWDKMVRLTSEGGWIPSALYHTNLAQNRIKRNTIPKDLLITPLDIEYFDNSAIGDNYDPLKDNNPTNKPIIQKVYNFKKWLIENQEKWTLPKSRDTF